MRLMIYMEKNNLLNDEINGIQEFISKLIVKEKLYAENQRIEVKKYKRDSSLFAGSVIAESDLENSHQSLLKVNIELQEARLDHSAKSIELSEKRQLFRITG